ncbi:hypothetical protein WMY93_000698 [Mugilogobius chulae]|uniref:MENTAL domain-containing protein n=1 Tax=Mugilogobius chulae TaxID=88201 RepID=A0AAW0Q357_9GOBI
MCPLPGTERATGPGVSYFRFVWILPNAVPSHPLLSTSAEAPHLPWDMESVCSSSAASRGELPACGNSGAPLSVCSDLFKPRKTFSDVRRTFCLFVTFDLLFISCSGS